MRHEANTCLNDQPHATLKKNQRMGDLIPKKKMQKCNRSVILLLNTWASQTLDTTSCIIHPVDATINSAWAETFSPTLQSKSCVKEGVRAAVMCLRGAASPESGWIFYTFFKVHRHFCVFSCIPASVCQCHCPRRDVAGNRADGWLVSPDAQQSVAPLPMAPWHKMRAHRLLLYTAADTGERRSCTVETEREEKSADWLQPAVTPLDSRRKHGRRKVKL